MAWLSNLILSILIVLFASACGKLVVTVRPPTRPGFTSAIVDSELVTGAIIAKGAHSRIFGEIAAGGGRYSSSSTRVSAIITETPPQ
jgi:hypothetical protein